MLRAGLAVFVRRCLMVGALWPGMGFIGPALAEEAFQSHDAIRQAVSDYLLAEGAHYSQAPVITVGRIDSRLRLQPCAEPLEVFQPPGGKLIGNVTVGVRCASPKQWSIYVQAKVAVLEQVLVASRHLQRGTPLERADLEFVEKDIATLSGGYLTDLDKTEGMILNRSIRAGMALGPHMLEAPKLVRRGDRVIILAAADGVEVRMAGEALSDGAEGELVRVRNLSSGREVEAEVVRAGVVRVRM